MDLQQQRQAQNRADRIAAFRAELSELEQEQGLTLTPEQRAQLEAHLQRVLADLKRQFGAEISEPEKRISWGMRLVSLLGGLAFFVALYLFFQRIWGALPLGVQVGLLLGVPLVLLGAAAWAAGRNAAAYYVALLGLTAAAAVVLGLNALAAIFNTVPWAPVLLAWGVFAVLVAYAFDLRLLLAAGLLLLCAWTAAGLISLTGAYWESFMDHSQYLIPGAIALYAVPTLSRGRNPRDFDSVYRMCGAGVGLVALLVLSKSADLCCPGSPSRMVETLYQLAGLLASAGVVWHGLRLGRNGPVSLGAGGFATFLFTCLHAWWWDWMPKYLFFLVIGLIALGLLAVFQRLRRRLKTERSVA